MNAGVFQQTVKSAKMVDERKKLHDEQDRRNRRYEEDHADDVSKVRVNFGVLYD